jgi:signal transduction histidine kinase
MRRMLMMSSVCVLLFSCRTCFVAFNYVILAGWDNYLGFVQIAFVILLSVIAFLGIGTYAKKRRGIYLERLVKERTSELVDANKRLEELNKQMNLFLGIAAHDLRNPISSIYGISDVLMEDYKDEMPEETHQFIERIKSSSEFMLNLVNEFLDLAAIQSGDLKLKKEEINCIDFIEDIIAFNSFVAKHKHIGIISDFQISDKQTVTIDKNKSIQLFNNLISNAVKFSPENTIITIEAKIEKDVLVISVRDEGPGIASKDLDNLFNVFVQGETRSTNNEKGVGLGLSICKKIVEAHGGFISVYGEVNKGTTFYFTCPLSKAQLQDLPQVHLESIKD